MAESPWPDERRDNGDGFVDVDPEPFLEDIEENDGPWSSSSYL